MSFISRQWLTLLALAIVFIAPQTARADLDYLSVYIRTLALDFSNTDSMFQHFGQGDPISIGQIFPTVPVTGSSTAISPDALTSVSQANFSVSQVGDVVTINLHHSETLGVTGGTASQQFQIAFGSDQPVSYALTSTWSNDAYFTEAGNTLTDLVYPGGFYNSVYTDVGPPVNRSGTFGSLDISTVSGHINYFNGYFSLGGFGPTFGDGDFTITLTPVPEPSSLALAGIGLAAYVAIGIRQRRQ